MKQLPSHCSNLLSLMLQPHTPERLAAADRLLAGDSDRIYHANMLLDR
jgi:hypothetical protein